MLTVLFALLIIWIVVGFASQAVVGMTDAEPTDWSTSSRIIFALTITPYGCIVALIAVVFPSILGITYDEAIGRLKELYLGEEEA